MGSHRECWCTFIEGMAIKDSIQCKYGHIPFDTVKNIQTYVGNEAVLSGCHNRPSHPSSSTVFSSSPPQTSSIPQSCDSCDPINMTSQQVNQLSNKKLSRMGGCSHERGMSLSFVHSWDMVMEVCHFRSWWHLVVDDAACCCCVLRCCL